jgi:hypothetical protein
MRLELMNNMNPLRMLRSMHSCTLANDITVSWFPDDHVLIGHNVLQFALVLEDRVLIDEHVIELALVRQDLVLIDFSRCTLRNAGW